MVSGLVRVCVCGGGGGRARIEGRPLSVRDKVGGGGIALAGKERPPSARMTPHSSSLRCRPRSQTGGGGKGAMLCGMGEGSGGQKSRGIEGRHVGGCENVFMEG